MLMARGQKENKCDSSSYEPSTRFSGQRKMKDGCLRSCVRAVEVAYC
jgi:hypothetical protein